MKQEKEKAAAVILLYYMVVIMSFVLIMFDLIKAYKSNDYFMVSLELMATTIIMAFIRIFIKFIRS